jgi:hypothetical protein
MKKYNTEDYFSVIEKKTGKKICDCAEEIDALMMVSFDPQNRTYTRNKFLMGPVVDIDLPKTLPTSAIDTVDYREHQENWMVEKLNELPQIKLPEDKRDPFIV